MYFIPLLGGIIPFLEWRRGESALDLLSGMGLYLFQLISSCNRVKFLFSCFLRSIISLEINASRAASSIDVGVWWDWGCKWDEVWCNSEKCCLEESEANVAETLSLFPLSALSPPLSLRCMLSWPSMSTSSLQKPVVFTISSSCAAEVSASYSCLMVGQCCHQRRWAPPQIFVVVDQCFLLKWHLTEHT